MGFLLKEEKENLLLEYNMLREEIWDRDYKTWVINAILIVGSLLAAFAPSASNFPSSILSLVLVSSALVLHVTSAQVTSVGYARLDELAKQMNLRGPKLLFESRISGQWWYVARRNVAYVLFAVLISVYLYYIFNNLYVLGTALVVGFLLIILKGERSGKGEVTKIEYHYR
jgi:hypothetical protein